MFSYEFLDKMADAYTPLLGIVWLALVARSAISRRWRQGFWRLAFGLSALAIAYALMWADNASRWWPSMGLDYSTHAAVALALATAIGASSHWLRLPVILTVLAYFVLMLYQRYHTIADIASTSAAMAVPLAALTYALLDRVQAASGLFEPNPLRGSP